MDIASYCIPNLSQQNGLDQTFLALPPQVEAACWQMLESNTGLLVKHQAMLDQLIEEHPELAKMLILMGRKEKLYMDFVDQFQWRFKQNPSVVSVAGNGKRSLFEDFEAMASSLI